MSETNMQKIMSDLRETIAYASEEASDDVLELCVQALDAYEESLASEQAIWPEELPISKNRIAFLLSASPQELHYKKREKETEAQLRLRIFRDRVHVEQIKRELLWKYVQEIPDGDFVKFKQALEFADEVHDGQFRDSGELYIIHPLEVGLIILDIGMDSDAVIAGVLHDTVEDNPAISLDIIAKKFGIGVAGLVDGVTKLTRAGEKTNITKEQQQAESMRKMFLAMARDIRVIPVKLADRLHNMRTLEYCHSEKRVRKAQETLEIYAPLAHRLGMGQIKCELEDLSFMHINPEAYEDLKIKLKQNQEMRGEFLNKAMDEIREAVESAGIKATINGRPKHLYSIYRKLQAQKIPLEQVYDLIAIRVIVPSPPEEDNEKNEAIQKNPGIELTPEEKKKERRKDKYVDNTSDCYNVLGIIHGMWHPLPHRIKDYVSNPKPNGYRSLHTTVIGENGIPFEVQIRTEKMHKLAEFGIAAHWKYKEGRSASSDLDLVLDWMRNLMAEKIEDSDEFMRVLKLDFFSEFVFVFSPRGDIIDLVMGSTPIDFAYRIHSDVGNKCVGAKVNNKIVPLDYQLQMNDIVEIITSNSSPGPKRDWLNIVRSHQARTKIKQFFRSELKEENIQLGKEMLEQEARKQGYVFSKLLTEEQVPTLFRRLSLNNMSDLCAAVGFGSVSVAQIIPRLIDEIKKADQEEQQRLMLEEIAHRRAQLATQSQKPDQGIIVKGESGMLVRLARCCSPVPGDKIVGYITRGRGVSVHKADCKNLSGLHEGQVRFIDVEWAGKRGKFTANIQIDAAQRKGLMMDITRLFVNMNISITGINAKTDSNDIGHITLEFEVSGTDQLDQITAQIYRIPDVISVFRKQA